MTSTNLVQLAEWPRDAVRRLAQSWVTTAEQVVSAANVPEGIHNLATQAGTTDDEMNRLVSVAKSALGSERVKELEAPVDTSQFGLGGRQP